MEAGLIVCFSENIYSDNYVGDVAKFFLDNGIKFSVIEIVEINDGVELKRKILDLRNRLSLLFILDYKDGNSIIREVVSKTFDAPLFVNNIAKDYCLKNSGSFNLDQTENMYSLPFESVVIPNDKGIYQGFFLDKEQFILAVLPDEINQLKSMCKSHLFPFLEKRLPKRENRVTFKYFGSRDKLIGKLEETKKTTNVDFKYGLIESFGDIRVDLLFLDNISSLDKTAVLTQIFSVLSEEIYAEENKSLSERLFDYLRLTNKKIAIAESFTGGRVVSEIIKNSGISEYLNEGIVSYSNYSKMSRLNVKKEDLQKHGAVSSVVAFQMAVGLLKTKKVDIAISTTGLAGPNSDESKKDVGLFFIGVGTLNGVHTYKFNFNGDRETITETAKNTALFLAIKNLRDIKEK